MKARVGDRVVVEGHRVGEAKRSALILEIRGEHGEPPYLVRWSDDDHEALMFPGSDARIEHRRVRTPA